MAKRLQGKNKKRQNKDQLSMRLGAVTMWNEDTNAYSKIKTYNILTLWNWTLYSVHFLWSRVNKIETHCPGRMNDIMHTVNTHMEIFVYSSGYKFFLFFFLNHFGKRRKRNVETTTDEKNKHRFGNRCLGIIWKWMSKNILLI